MQPTVDFHIDYFQGNLQKVNHVIETGYAGVSKTNQFIVLHVTFLTTASLFSYLTDKVGYNIKNGWKKLNERIPSHENSILQKEMYISF